MLPPHDNQCHHFGIPYFLNFILIDIFPQLLRLYINFYIPSFSLNIIKYVSSYLTLDNILILDKYSQWCKYIFLRVCNLTNHVLLFKYIGWFWFSIMHVTLCEQIYAYSLASSLLLLYLHRMILIVELMVERMVFDGSFHGMHCYGVISASF